MIDIRSHHVFMAFFIAVFCHALAIYSIGQIHTEQEPVTLTRVIEGLLITPPQPELAAPVQPAAEPMPEKQHEVMDKPLEKHVAKNQPEPESSETSTQPSDAPLPETNTDVAVSSTNSSAAVAPEPVFTPPRVDAKNRDNPPPVYPRIARRLGQEGTVMLEVFILADGSVGDARLKTSSGHARLDDAALEAVRGWRYVPARLGDKAVSHWYTQSVKFVLN